MTEVRLRRTQYLDDRTLGELSVWVGPVMVFHCVSLELPWANNANRVSCVPADTYVLLKEYSNSKGRELYELKNVPGRSECKIHSANYPHELLGCIAPGMFLGDIDKDGKLDTVSSRKAEGRFHEALRGIIDTTIVIIGDGRDVLKMGVNGWRM